MKLELRAKYLQYLNQKKQDEGFTLIELLVVIIIIGILSAIALPSFLNQANKARESEAKQYIGSINRAQQAYYLEREDFAGSGQIGRLGLGIQENTQNYSYVLNRQSDSAVTNQAQPAKANNASVRAFIGGVAVGTITATSEATTLAVLCQGNDAPVANGPTGTDDVNATLGTAACTSAGDYISIE